MRFLYLIFLLVLAIACSADVEEKHIPKKAKKSAAPIEKKSTQPLNIQSKPVDEHISGGGAPQISGASSSSHTSGR